MFLSNAAESSHWFPRKIGNWGRTPNQFAVNEFSDRYMATCCSLAVGSIFHRLSCQSQYLESLILLSGLNSHTAAQCRSSKRTWHVLLCMQVLSHISPLRYRTNCTKEFVALFRDSTDPKVIIELYEVEFVNQGSNVRRTDAGQCSTICSCLS